MVGHPKIDRSIAVEKLFNCDLVIRRNRIIRKGSNKKEGRKGPEEEGDFHDGEAIAARYGKSENFVQS